MIASTSAFRNGNHNCAVIGVRSRAKVKYILILLLEMFWVGCKKTSKNLDSARFNEIEVEGYVRYDSGQKYKEHSCQELKSYQVL